MKHSVGPKKGGANEVTAGCAGRATNIDHEDMASNST